MVRVLPKHWSQLQTNIVLISIAYAVVFLLMLALRPTIVLYPGGEKFYQGFHNIYQIIAPVFAGVCSILYTRRGEHASATRRAGWFCLGLAGWSFALGQSAWTYYETIRHVETPSPGLADVGYVGAYPFLIGGVILLFGSIHIAGRLRLLLDSAIAASSVGVLSWYFLVQHLWSESDTELLAKLISLAYPLGDVAALFGAVVLLNSATATRSLRRSSVFIAGGIVLLAFADIGYTYYNLHDQYHTGSWFDWGWSFGWLLIGYASLLPLWWPRDAEAPTVSQFDAPGLLPVPALPVLPVLTRVMLPYLAAIVAFTIVALRDYSDHAGHISNSVLLAGLWLIFLVVFRQVLTLLENQNLTTQLRALNASLEQRVEQRTSELTSLTEQLSALLQLTKAVNSTLQGSQVLAIAAEHIRQTLQADAVVLCRWDGETGDCKNDPFIHPQAALHEHPQVLKALTARSMPEAAQTLEAEILALPASRTSVPAHAPLMPSPIVPPDAPNRASNGASNGTFAQSPQEPGLARGTGLRAPLLWQSQPIGMVGVVRWSAPFADAEPEMLESIGIEVGVALENARLYSEAVEAADRDPVTGLFNHRAIHQRLDAEFHRAERQHRPLSVMMMDLNNFKLFNDTYGHPVGDQILKNVAEALRSECRKFDILGRYGGDEFIAILPDTDEPLAMVVAQRLRDRMARESFQEAGDERDIPVTLSFGFATYPTDSASRYELLTRADANLYTAKFSDEGIQGTSETQRASRELRSESSFNVLDAMVNAVDNKDRYTRRHSEDVTQYALWVAEELGLSDETMRIIRVAGLLHDVGKVAVPEEILRKPGRLTEEEYEIMKRHPQLGALIVGGMPGMENIVDAVRSHHERWDGKGYPDGLAGEGIPVLGRLMAVADAFSAMTTARPYRRGMDWDAAVEEIRANSGTQFDPAAARAFLIAAKKHRDTAEPHIRQPSHLQLVPRDGQPAAAQSVSEQTMLPFA